MIDGNVTDDPFARYVSRLKDARLERLNAAFGQEESRSTGLEKGLQSAEERLKGARDKVERASASPRREDVEFADRTDELLAQASVEKSISRDYLAGTRPGVIGLPKRLGLRAIRYAVKTYTDGLFAQQEAFNAHTTSLIAGNARQIKSLLSRGNELEQKVRLQQDFNRDVISCVRAMSDAVCSLSDAVREQREFGSLIVSLLNDVIDGSSELATTLNERADQRLVACEKRLDEAEDVLRQHAEEHGSRLDAAESSLGQVFSRSDKLEASVRAIDKRFEEDERRIEQLVDDIASTSKSVQDTHSFFSLQLEAVDSRIEHSEIRAEEASKWMSNLDARATKSEERLARSEEGLARCEEWLGNVDKEVASSKQWLSNVDKEIASSKQWLENLASDVKGHGEWLSDIGSQVNSHADWLANVQGTVKEHNDWLATLDKGRQQLEVWTGNLQKSQEQHASQLAELAQHAKEIDHQVFFVKRKLEASSAGPTLVPLQERPDDVGQVAAEPGLSEDEYLIFEERFRGESDALKMRQEHYLEHFKGCKSVLDLGCGRGEFLELLKEQGIKAIGVDSNPEMVRVCNSKGLEARHADLVEFLEAAGDGSFDGIFCAQVMEHFKAGQVLRLCKLMAQKLAPGGVVVIETIDPRSIYALVNNFLLDPSHLCPIHPRLLEFGFSLTDVDVLQVERLAPVAPEERLDVSAVSSTVGSNAAFQGLVERNFGKLDDFLFGYQDYAVVGRKA